MGSVTLATGQQLVTTAKTAKEMDALFEDAICLALGIMVDPIQVSFNLVSGSQVATTGSTRVLYVGLMVAGPGLPVNTQVIISQVYNDTTVQLSSAPTETGSFPLTVSDNEKYKKVQVGWVTNGQPGFSVADDVVFVESETYDAYTGSIRDLETVGTTSTYSYTVPWRIHFVLYGPNGWQRAGIIRSTMLLDFIHDYLAGFNLYLNPDTKVPKRNAESFQKQWFDRTDMYLEFNEFVTETIAVGTGTSVEVIVSTPTNPQAITFVVEG